MTDLNGTYDELKRLREFCGSGWSDRDVIGRRHRGFVKVEGYISSVSFVRCGEVGNNTRGNPSCMLGRDIAGGMLGDGECNG